MSSPVIEPLLAALRLPQIPWILLAAYLVGSIPFGFLLGRGLAKVDVRSAGSGNIGATNVARVLGARLGVLTLVLDVGKGAVAVLFVGALLDAPSEIVRAASGMAGTTAVIGHCFPVWLRFNGGKGAAAGLGAILAHFPAVGGIALAVFVITYIATRWVSLGSIMAAISMVPAYLLLVPVGGDVLPLAVMLLVLLLRHRSNMARLLRRAELKT